VEPSGIAHTGFAAASLVLGVGVLRRPKGTELHRIIGVLYVFCMFGLNVTALTIYRVFGDFGAFHVLSVINLAILLAGFGAVFLKRPRRTWLQYHYYLMGWSYVGLWAATATEIAVRIPGVSFIAGVTVPTVCVTIAGGAWVQLQKRRTLATVKQGQRAA